MTELLAGVGAIAAVFTISLIGAIAWSYIDYRTDPHQRWFTIWWDEVATVALWATIFAGVLALVGFAIGTALLHGVESCV